MKERFELGASIVSDWREGNCRFTLLLPIGKWESIQEFYCCGRLREKTGRFQNSGPLERGGTRLVLYYGLEGNKGLNDSCAEADWQRRLKGSRANTYRREGD